MKTFVLDSRLAADCFVLHDTPHYILLRMNNALLPWLILVPKVDVSEWYELDKTCQDRMMGLVNRLSAFIKQEYTVDKLNIATIGNIVSQLHIHIVGRRQDDYCWPNVVWGAEGREDIPADEVKALASKVKEYLQANEK